MRARDVRCSRGPFHFSSGLYFFILFSYPSSSLSRIRVLILSRIATSSSSLESERGAMQHMREKAQALPFFFFFCEASFCEGKHSTPTSLISIYRFYLILLVVNASFSSSSYKNSKQLSHISACALAFSSGIRVIIARIQCRLHMPIMAQVVLWVHIGSTKKTPRTPLFGLPFCHIDNKKHECTWWLYGYIRLT